MPIKANAKITKTTVLKVPWKGGKGKWEQFSRKKVVPRDAMGFALRLKILKIL